MKRHNAFEEELAVLRRSVLDAVHARDEYGVEQGIEVYERLVQRFVTKLKDLGATYDQRAAHREVSESIGGGWSELEWIRDDYAKILRAAMGTQDFSIIHGVLYFPIRIAWIAFESQDFLSFTYFMAFPSLAFKYSHKLVDPETREIVLDKIARYPHEFVDYGLTPRLEHAESTADIEWVEALSEGMVATYNDLLKAAVDANDRASFILFLKHFRQLFENYDDRLAGYRDWAELEAVGHPPGDTSDLFKPLKSALTTLADLRSTALLGLGGWLIRHIQFGTPAERYEDWFPQLGLEGDIERLTRSYLIAKRERHEPLLRWGWWSLEGKEEGVAHWGGFDQYLDVAYVIAALRTVSVTDAPAAIREFGDHDVYVMEESGSLTRILGEIESNLDKWGSLLPPEPLTRIAALRNTFGVTIAYRREVREREVVNALLSPSRVNEFASAEEKGYRRETEFLRLVRTIGKVRQVPEAARPDRHWGFHELLPKDWFVEGSNTEITHFGEQHGSNLRHGVVDRILREIVLALPGFPLEDDIPLSTLIEPKILALKARGASPLILLAGGFRLYQRLGSDPGFSSPGPVWGPPREGTLIGSMGDTEVHGIHWRGFEMVLVCDLKRIGTWEQVMPVEVKQDERILADEVRFTLRLLQEDEARKWVAERPDLHLKKKEDGAEESIEDAVYRLRQKVVHRLTTSAHFAIEDRESGLVFRKPGEAPQAEADSEDSEAEGNAEDSP